ncbi:MAG: hypothetical protein E7033_00610 [Akkermansiaceae bacterium]|nr:hypothetical protein [Akkermansiaceae bacterium]
MKHLVILLTIGLFVAAPVTMAESDDAPKSSAELRVEKKEAAAWYKKKLARQKKAIAALKKVKDEKSAKKAASSIMKLYGHLVGGEQTAMGTTGAAEVPSGEAADEVAAKYEKQLDKLQEQLNKELERIGELELSVPELDEAIDAVNKY